MVASMKQSYTITVTGEAITDNIAQLLTAAGIAVSESGTDIDATIVAASTPQVFASVAANLPTTHPVIAYALSPAPPADWIEAGAAAVASDSDTLLDTITLWAEAAATTYSAGAAHAALCAWHAAIPSTLARVCTWIGADEAAWLDTEGTAVRVTAPGLQPPQILHNPLPSWLTPLRQARRLCLCTDATTWALAVPRAPGAVASRSATVVARGRNEVTKPAHALAHAMLLAASAPTLHAVPSLNETTVLELIGDGIVILHRDGTVAYANRSLAAMLGRTPESLRGLYIGDIVPAAERSDFEAQVQTWLGGGPAPRELTLLDRDGRKRHCALKAVASGDNRIVVDLHDVTEERELTQELLRAKRLFEDIVTSSPNAVVVADGSGAIQLLNPVAENLTGWRLGDAQRAGLRFADLFADADSTAWLERVHAERRRGEPGRLTNVRAQLRTRQQQRIPILLNAVALGDEHSDGAGTMAILTDIRQLLAMEQELNEARRQVIQSEREATLVALAGATAHHLNQPLTAVLGYVQMLKRRQPELGSNPAILKIEAAAEQMAAIVREIGRITRFETTDYGHRTRILELSEREA